jgi:hypothetical protein
MHGDELFALAAGLAEALVALHDVGIVHRDLKPQNVVCSPAGPRVLDLGIARSMEDQGLTRTGMMIGSPAWMSPERFKGQNSTPAADVYAWSMMVAYAATGVIPFGTGAPEVVALRVLQEEADTSGVPHSLRGIVDWGADKDPLRRPSAHQLLASVTQSWRGALGVGAPALDPVSDATSLIDMHWGKGEPGGAPWEAAPVPGWDAPATATYQGYGIGRGLSVPPPPAAPPPSTNGYAAYGSTGAATGAHAQHGDTLTGMTLDGVDEGKPTGRRRASARKSRQTPVIAAVAAVAVIGGAVAVYAAAGGGDKKNKAAPAAAPSPTGPKRTAGPAPYVVKGLKFMVPPGWDAWNMDATSVCVAPVDLPPAVHDDCLHGGLRIWVGDDANRKVALDDPDGWTLGAPLACPGDAPGADKPVGRSSKKQFPKLGDLTYEYAQFNVKCADGSHIEPQIWWLPTSKISFSTQALPKSYDSVVKELISAIDKSNYKPR